MSTLGYTGAVVVEPACARIPVDRGTLDEDGVITDPAVRAQLADVLDMLAKAR
ncbi:hypothetical protein [Streptomyces sp. NPDC046821]|uniref:hypothetical protein n=1 Tax=Streptomyces sp. NPDC046821 TaxID=3154702 RepID=UPI0034023830